MARIADRVGAWLIVDEVYAGLEWEAPRAPSIAGLYERGITTGSVSKALGLQGLRTGWMICREPAIMDAVILRENSSEIMNIMGEVIAGIALRPERLDAAMERARAEGARTSPGWTPSSQDKPRLSWGPPRAGLIGLARLDGIAAMISHGSCWRLHIAPFCFPAAPMTNPHIFGWAWGAGPRSILIFGLSQVSDLLKTLK